MIKPHGGKLVDRIMNESERKQAVEQADGMKSLKIEHDAITDLMNIAHGVFSPIEGFFGSEDLDSVVKGDKLANGLPWTIPITLNAENPKFSEGEKIVLRHGNGTPVAFMDVDDIYDYDRNKIAKAVFGTVEKKHPGVRKLHRNTGKFIGGKIKLIQEVEFPFKSRYLSPKETRAKFQELGWNTVVAFQTRNPPHRAHEYIQKCALEIVDGIFINPVIGKKKPGDFTDDLILNAYDTATEGFYPDDRAYMSILPWEMRYAGPKEAIFHCIVRKNFGCTHHIIGRDHAGVGDYYDTYAAHRIFKDFPDLGIQPLLYEHSFYCKSCGNMATTKTCPHGKEVKLNPSGTKIREIVTEGKDIDPYIMRPEVAGVLKKAEVPFVE